VLSVDEKAKRIALSIKALSAPAPRPAAKPAPKPELVMQDKLAALSNKWKTRT
jgi:protein Tex